MNLVIICRQYSRGNGGSSSLIDLGLAAVDAGARVDMVVTQQHGIRLLYAIGNSILNAKRSVFVRSAPLPLRQRPDTRTRVGEYTLAFMRELVGLGIENAATKNAACIIARADVIVFAEIAEASYLSYVRSLNSTARLIFNHPGSPDAFLKYWLASKYNEGGKGTARARLNSYDRILSMFDAILFQSPHQADELAALLPRQKHKTICVRPSVDEAALNKVVRRKRIVKKADLRIVMIGSIQPRKNQIEGIRIFKALASRYPKLTLYVVGGFINSQYKRSVECEITRLGLDERVVLTGHRKDYASYLVSADLLLHTAIAEGVPRVIREAMYVGTPVVSSDISGVSDLLEHGRSAILFPSGYIDTAVAGIAGLLSNPLRRKRLALAAGQDYRERHSRLKLARNVKRQILTTGSL